MTHHTPNSTNFELVLELLTEHGCGAYSTALEILMNEAMLLERSKYLGAGPFERTGERIGYANGFKPKGLKMSAGHLDLRVPKTRDTKEGMEPFYPNALERGSRSERALSLALAEMYVQGVSTRKVAAITEQLCGFEVSSMQVSRASKLLDEELESWRTRPLGETPYVIIDARYEKVRIGGQVRSVAVLIAIGVNAEGKRIVLGISVSLSEAEVHWRRFLESLVQRGLHGIQMVTSDDHSGLRAALRAVLPSTPWQRCQFHLQQNAQAYIPRAEMKKPVAAKIRAIFNAPNLSEAWRSLKIAVEELSARAPELATWMEANIPDGFSVFSLPETHRKRLRTSNAIERLNREFRRRSRVATLFPNEASLLRLGTAVVVEISEEWETGRIYLNMNPDA